MIRYEELRPEHWKAIETLFGPSGACGGCWCMWWRVPRGGKLWEATKGAPAREKFRALVRKGEALGILAFDGKTPIGWCAFGPRTDFPRLERVKAFRRDDAALVWSVNCFFIDRRHRGRSVARGLLDAAVEAARRRGATMLEGYPVTSTAAGGRVSASFAYTGPWAIFESLGFEEVQRLAPTRPLVRLRLENTRRSKRPSV